ncbi:MAG: GntR family transcriptional regulator [Lachnospiraceae bacterium]|nr:GntR family transcriptional regulator [Lachnospiraceae bacterium]MDE6698283.1 GntR family transcriptional regulator [Lachnospiraceae bacterium]
MFQLDLLSRVPVYEQIINQLESLVLSDILMPHTQLPSVRGLSVQLSINPNTIQKAYSELDRRGIIYSVPGRGCFVSEDSKSILSSLSRNKLKPLTSLLGELKLAGIEKEEIISIVDSVYEKGNEV